MIDVRTFLDTVANYSQQPSSAQSDGESSPFRLGTVDPGYSSGDPRVLLDDDVEMTDKQFKRLNNVPVSAQARVLLAKVGNSFVVLGTLS